MNGIKALQELFNTRKAEEAKRNSVIAELEKKNAALDAAAEAAASAGDVEGYIEKAEARRKNEATLYVLRKTNKKAQVTEDEVVSAWNSFREDYSKQFEKAFGDYRKKREALAAAYIGLVEMQNEALKMREQLGKLAGMNGEKQLGQYEFSYDAVYKDFLIPALPECPTGHLQSVPGANLHLKYGSMRVADPDSVFFHVLGIISDDDLDKINDVVRQRHSH